VPFISGNPFIFICFILSAVIALYGAVIVIFLWFHARRMINKKYSEYLEKQRKLALTKKDLQEHQVDSNEGPQKDKIRKKKTNIIRYLKQGLFHASVLVDELAMIERNQQKEESEQSTAGANSDEAKGYNISFFKIPTLFFDIMLRRNTNSLLVFVEYVPESPYHFTAIKMESNQDYHKTSIMMHHFLPIYHQFCIRFGYVPLDIAEQVDVLRQFRLKLEFKMDKKTKVITNIRWKRPAEKQGRSSDKIMS